MTAPPPDDADRPRDPSGGGTVHLVAVHGNGGGAARFDRLPRPLSPGVALHTPTLPGFGGRPLGEVDGVGGLAEALHAELPDTDEPVVLLGHGIGGSVALELLARHPEAVDGLVLHAPVGTRLDTRWFPRLMSPGWVRRAVQLAISSPLLRPALRRTIVRGIPQPWADDFLAAYADAEAFGAMFDWLTSDWFDSLPPRPLPAVLLWGSDDRVLGADQRADYHALLPEATERTVQGWGHFPMLTDPDHDAEVVAGIARDLAAATADDPGADREAEDARPPVQPLALLGSGDRRTAGVPAKAGLLDRLARRGAPVPRGAVATAADLADPPVEVARRIAATLPGARVAVRSSFAAEDGATSSNAGRFTTVLDVPTDDLDALAGAVGSVVASAGDEVDEDHRAVLVQVMVEARHAGVAFTQPAYEDDLVDVVEGLADGLVAGRVEGERVALPRLVAGEPPDHDGWRGRLQGLLRGVRTALGDEPGEAGWDVEWADDGTTCWLVQVRPVTAPPLRDEVLTLANHREILPDPPSVLMTSLVLEAGPGAFDYWRSHSPDLPLDRPFMAPFAGRPLINLSLLTDSMRRLGLPTSFVTDSMGGSEAERVVRTVGPRPTRLARHLPALLSLGVDQLGAPAQAPKVADRLAARAEDLGDGFTGALDATVDVYVGLLQGMFALSTAVSGPLAVLQRLGVSAEHHARHRSAGTAVWDDLEPLRALVAEDATRRAAVEGGELPDDGVFRTAWARFLDAHGHRGVYESDLARPRYAEDPTPLLGLLLAPDRDRDVPPRTLLGRLTTPLWWQAGRAIRAREQLRSDAMRSFAVLRARLLELAEDAVAAELLPATEDVWLCTLDQLRGIDAGEPVTQTDVAAARERRERVAAVRLPDVVRSSDDPAEFTPDASARASRRLRGLPLTGGDVEGTVWRLDEPAGAPPPHDGPLVLVCPAVDPGWVATFAQVDAVVVETGGELSHGSIVLRERSVPAVTNVRGATALRDGDRVRVRAAAGVVELVAGGDDD